MPIICNYTITQSGDYSVSMLTDSRFDRYLRGPYAEITSIGSIESDRMIS